MTKIKFLLFTISIFLYQSVDAQVIYRCENSYTKNIELATKQSCKVAQQGQIISKNAAREFTVTPPKDWVPTPLETGNTKIAFSSKNDAFHAECAVASTALEGEIFTQHEINLRLSDLPTKDELKSGFSSYKNVQISNIRTGLLSGRLSQIFDVRYSVGTADDEIWAVSTIHTTMSPPNILWAVTCGSGSKTMAEAQKAYTYWQVIINNFPTTFKIIK